MFRICIEREREPAREREREARGKGRQREFIINGKLGLEHRLRT